jgi:hypothetical protein
MATLAAQAIRRAVRECLTGALVSARSPTLGYASDDLFTNSEPFTEMSRAMVKPTFDVAVSSISRQEESPSTVNNILLYTVAVTVTVSYKLDAAILSPDLFDVAKSNAERDCDVFTRALGWPGALTQTLAAVPTGLVSGLLRSTGSTIVADEPVEGLYQVALGFEGTAIVNVTA